MISIVTGTLNRKHLLSRLIKNTVEKNDQLELILVDGGSTDGTIDYIKSLSAKNIKLIEVGKRSSYPHFMNLGISSASYDYICQWNDDVLFLSSWKDVIDEIQKKESDAYLFGWQSLSELDLVNLDRLKNINWNICNQKHTDPTGEIVMNYGVYRKDLFKLYGGYDENFVFYYADGELSHRFFHKGVRFKDCYNFRVATLNHVQKTSSVPKEWELNYYNECRKKHIEGSNSI